MKKAFCSVAFLCIALLHVQGAAADAKPTTELQALVNTQFGPQFVLLQNYPVLTGDFNGDGVEDAVFVATAHGGLQMNSGRFRVLDPSSAYFGIGDPHITSQFASGYPEGPRYLLIIHGSGTEAWHAKEPKDRFVIINVAFDHIALGHVTRKKKSFDDINVEETGVLSSFVYWDGRKYKWQPGAAEL
jgi:hypothetical protein